ncbi:hypothetical protein G5714_018165 [Onychostoma macrolepis]|uniref:Uncharacterized protein n=1 Tax=Onychostoma macrolepis TaxID=369639 RepID=A0A7J6C4Q4_9TELE|nr:hypothetical protein G5714_018165 [Onychostoma macrolepis]
MSAKDKRKKVIYDHVYSSAATDSPPTDSSSADLPIFIPPTPDTPLSSPMPKRNKDLKNDKTKLAEKFTQQHKSLVNLEERIADAEHYKRRWCLCLYGLSEQPNEDVKANVLDICNAVAPESCQKGFDVIDIAHRLGKPQPGKIRAVIILFTLRSVRDAVWRNAKSSEFLKQRKLHFVEDLTKEEKDKQSLLWPHVKKAREDNKKVYYIRSKAFIEGVEIKLNAEGQKNKLNYGSTDLQTL